MTRAIEEIALAAVPVGRLRETAGPRAWERLIDAQACAGEVLAGRSLWSISSTAIGGGVAEMQRALMPYTRGGGIDAHWLVVRGSADFFAVTKRIHNFLHGHLGDSGPLGQAERAVYQRVIENAGWALRDVIRHGDVVVLHDPQTVGLVCELKRLGAKVIWRCHIGTNEPGGLSDVAWDFLWGYIEEADVAVFSRRASVPARLPRQSVRLIAPSIDPCSVKNADMPLELAAAILDHTGLVARTEEASEAPAFHRTDGSSQRVRHRCDMLRTGPAPRLGRDQLVVHASRWDRIKDPIGVMHGFVEHTLPHVQAHLILAGGTVHAVTDDPEEPETLDEVQAAWRALGHQQRARVTIACLPMHDVEENAAIVNALQRHADVIVKKSLEEGFGLGVTEALWKRRAVVASDVGGHRDQIRDQHSGLLVDPADACSFGNAIAELLANPGRASALGDAGHEIVKQLYLDSRQLAEWDELLAAVAEPTGATSSARERTLEVVRNRSQSRRPAEVPGHNGGQIAAG
jgi:trehalose synthase